MSFLNCVPRRTSRQPCESSLGRNHGKLIPIGPAGAAELQQKSCDSNFKPIERRTNIYFTWLNNPRETLFNYGNNYTSTDAYFPS